MLDRNSEIIRLWNENNSATYIACELSITRNIVIGVITRARAAGLITKPIVFEFTKRARASARSKPIIPKDRKIRSAFYPMNKSENVYQDDNGSNENGIALIDLEHNQCRFPTNRFDGQHYFCGAVTRDSRTSYCAEHHAKVFVKKRKLTPAEIVELKKMQSLKQWLSGAQR